MTTENITFSFGKNWSDYAKTISVSERVEARRDIEQWLGCEYISGKTVVDIGCGSGLHSLAFHSLNAKSVLSFDYDSESVNTTKGLWESTGKPGNWDVFHGSILDDDLVSRLGAFDIVYSWGVLHHTGQLWNAMRNACRMVARGGILFIAIYEKGPRYEADLALKRKYNKASPLGKRIMIYRWIANIMWTRLKSFRNPFSWNVRYERGMNTYHDLIDWLGGLPYEVASEDEVVVFCRKMGLVLERIQVKCEGACSIYVFRAFQPSVTTVE